MNFSELANSDSSYSASLSEEVGVKGEAVIIGREKDKMQNITWATVQALERQCIVKVTAYMRHPKSQSHCRCLMSSW